MPKPSQPGVLPLRPMTTGELLDAAVVLLRGRTARLLSLGLILALLEQIILFALRRNADLDARFLPDDDRLVQFGVLLVAGMGTEAAVIAVLAAVASAHAPRALLATAPPRRVPVTTVAVIAICSAIVCAACGFAYLVLLVPLQVLGFVLAVLCTVVLWPLGYGFVGLAAPAAVIDRYGAGRALLRSARLASRINMRGVWVRLLGYLTWLAVRLGLGLAMLAAIELWFSSPSNMVDNLLMGAAWLVANTVAYPMLGCLDVALHLETRMRTEGLDIALDRARHRGVQADAALAVGT